MPKKQANRSGNTFGILLVCFAIIAASAVGLWLWAGRQPQHPAPDDSGPTTQPPAAVAVIDTIVEKQPPAVIGKEAITTQAELKDLMAERRARFGIDKGVDFIVSPDESIQVGGITVPMSEILDKIRLKRGDIIEKDIAGKRIRGEIKADLDAVEAQLQGAHRRAAAGDPVAHARAIAEIEELNDHKARLERELETLADGPDADRPVELYGIYVVRPNDNIWNIHFNFLKDLFNHKGIALSPLADEPTVTGQSSGVGKLLKFSESMVAIYNIRERRLDANLDRITPDTKVVVFNFNKVFAMLDQIDFHNINHIQFDGETIWIPAMQ